MCGICGVWGARQQPAIESMVGAMHHRGPDDAGIHRTNSAALGMTRLSIRDLSEAGHQPMSSPDGEVWIVYNGETYNVAENRRSLEARGYRFRSQSDTEIVLGLYLHHGDSFLQFLRGMYALAILDTRKGPGRERLLLARDPLGIKPLLYSGDASGMVFGSELKTLLASGLVSPEVDPVALHGLLAQGSVAQPATMLKHVRTLMPGHRMIVEAGRLDIAPFWELSADRRPDLARASYADQVAMLRGLLEDSVGAHMISDVRVGAFLSGGIDSTVLVALISQLGGEPLHTFSVGFGGEGRGIDETDAAARIAGFYGTRHKRVMVTGQDVRDLLTTIAGGLDQPSVDGLNSFFVSRAAAGEVKVAISGTGGDEPFAGYPWFADMARFQAATAATGLRGGARSLAAAVGSAASRFRMIGRAGGLASRLTAQGDFLEAYSRQYRIFGANDARQLMSRRLRSLLGEVPSDRQRAQLSDALPHADVVSRVSALCLRGYTQNQLLRDIDATSMCHSLEVRVPFLDVPLIDFALSLPDEAKLGRAPAGATYAQSGAKRILIDALRDILPPDLDRQKKQGFAMPYKAWMDGDLREILSDTTSASAIAARGLFDPKLASDIMHGFSAGRVSWAKPWLLMMTELWCREVLEKAR